VNATIYHVHFHILYNPFLTLIFPDAVISYAVDETSLNKLRNSEQV